MYINNFEAGVVVFSRFTKLQRGQLYFQMTVRNEDDCELENVDAWTDQHVIKLMNDNLFLTENEVFQLFEARGETIDLLSE